ncbi:triose-phosphate isomerase [Methylocella silvestris]|uniref:Triosephosphate isomerase n=1 Tax=Methylocella silvestris TaxID=199596 RepID=A0A2J7TDJ4_METSI|nr:triose-phosphate isomerase [Methylocella silvestris]PNG24831.1 triose-phosphate isomerase [Methylocella silvestris]
MTNGPSRSERRPLVAGNWKMNGLRKDLIEAEKICAATAAGEAGEAEVVICLPATLLISAAPACEAAGVGLGGQHCHGEPKGPFTGDLSAEMLRDAGASYVILGHSERRAGHNEGNSAVREKTRGAFRAGLTAIVCVGETRGQREAGDALPIVGSQLTGSIPGEATPQNLVIAYEPVWAIGTGLTPTLRDIAEMHRFIRERVGVDLPRIRDGIRILYGGSVKPNNAADLMRVPNVDGALVGGASLTAKDFMGIASVYRDYCLAS